jgi:hypothetical protein
MQLRSGLLVAISLSKIAPPAHSVDCARNLRRLEGWTIVRTGWVRGTFNGCEHDKLVELQDGTVLRCASYGYQYAFMPDAVVFAKQTTLGGQAATMIRLLVNDDLCDMAPILSAR